MEVNTNLFRRPTALVHSSFNLPTHWAIVKFTSQTSPKNGLRITQPIEANENIVNFLDVTLDLNNGKFKPYSKPTTTPLSVDSKSNHPPNIIRNIPEAISSDEETFNEAASPYQDALRKNGYSTNLKFKPEPPDHQTKEEDGETLFSSTHHSTKMCKQTSEGRSST